MNPIADPEKGSAEREIQNSIFKKALGPVAS
jgi:hypothetical protein